MNRSPTAAARNLGVSKFSEMIHVMLQPPSAAIANIAGIAASMVCALKNTAKPLIMSNADGVNATIEDSGRINENPAMLDGPRRCKYCAMLI
ncbi:hypothetical protein PBS_01960 [Paraburkholderia sp. 2C]